MLTKPETLLATLPVTTSINSAFVDVAVFQRLHVYQETPVPFTTWSMRPSEHYGTAVCPF